MNSRLGRFPVALAVSLLIPLAAVAQTLEWTGANLVVGNNTTSNGWGSGNTTTGNTTNWTFNGAQALPNSAGGPFALNIATGNFTPAVNPIDTMAVGGAWTLTSLTFDNAASLFPSQLRLSASSGTGTASRTLTFVRDANNNVINVVNGANVLISGNSSLITGFAGLNLVMNYSGMANINVDGTSSLTIGGNAATLRGSGTTVAGLVKTGAGSLTIGGASANYTGGFQLSGGTLWLAAGSNLTNGAQPGPFGNGTLTIDGGTKLASTSTAGRNFDNPIVFTGGTATLGDTVNSGLLTFTSAVNTGGTSAFQADTVLNVLSAVTLNRSMSGSGSLTKTGAGTLNLNQPMSYTGGTIFKEGQIQLGADNLPTNGAVTFDGGALRVGNTGFTAAGHATTILSGGAFFNISSGLFVTWSGDISGVGALTMNSTSAGTLTLNGTNTYSGGTVIDAGTVRGSVGTGSVAVASGATYDLFGADRTIGALSGAGNVTIGNRTLTVSSSASSTFSGLLSGTGGLTKDGTGTLTLAGTSSYTGATAVTGGTLEGVIGAGDLSVASGATYNLGGADRSLASFSGAGAIGLGANTLTTNVATSSTFSGSISGTGGLTSTGAGKLSLTGNNTYSGATQINAGGLIMNGILASPTTIASGASLGGTGTFTNNVTISGVHQPGNSPGVQTFQNLTYNSGASIDWELTSSTTTLGTSPNFNYDLIAVNGALTFAGPTTLNLRLDSAGSTVKWNDALWASDQSWTIFTSAGVTNFANLTLNTTNLVDSLNATLSSVRPGASFQLSVFNNNILLNYVVPVPEPATWQALLAGLAVAGLWWRRRRAT
jgi:autotransporter-associated beta strand protein